jgi:hypothetical protein
MGSRPRALAISDPSIRACTISRGTWAHSITPLHRASLPLVLQRDSLGSTSPASGGAPAQPAPRVPSASTANKQGTPRPRCAHAAASASLNGQDQPETWATSGF